MPNREISRAVDGLRKIMEEAADSSSIDADTKSKILDTLLAVSKVATEVFDMVEANKAFMPSVPHSLHAIEKTCGDLRMLLAGLIIERDPGALHMAMMLREQQNGR